MFHLMMKFAGSDSKRDINDCGPVKDFASTRPAIFLDVELPIAHSLPIQNNLMLAVAQSSPFGTLAHTHATRYFNIALWRKASFLYLRGPVLLGRFLFGVGINTRAQRDF